MTNWAKLGRNHSTCRMNVSEPCIPVLAMPMTSRPLMMTGTPWAWMGVGCVYSDFRMTLSSFSSKPKCANELTGLAEKGSSWMRYMKRIERTACLSLSIQVTLHVEQLTNVRVYHPLWTRTQQKTINSHLINHCPMSSGVSKVVERANEWVQWSA